jgi:hypothetical protein
MNWVQVHSPPCKGGEAAALIKSREATEEAQTGGAKRKPDRAQPQEKFGEMFRPEDFAELTTPAAPLWNGIILGGHGHPSFARRGMSSTETGSKARD